MPVGRDEQQMSGLRIASEDRPFHVAGPRDARPDQRPSARLVISRAPLAVANATDNRARSTSRVSVAAASTFEIRLTSHEPVESVAT